MTLIEKLEGLIDNYNSKEPAAQLRALDEESHTHAIEKAIELVEEHNPWTKVEDGLPPVKEDGYSEEVLVQFDDKDLGYSVGEYEDNGRWSVTGLGYTNLVTEWMYIPKTGKQ
jgi:hypothetical protein